ncbi:MAG: response regulator transcription factor [Oscillospiraceae bacterium]|jgi:DNA-binding response OmpR family regulator|nr:response regulator transcription factor [Oscillospiraceae bacterium]
MKGRILVAEDEKNIRDFVVMNLQHNDYEVISAENGREACEKFERDEEGIDMAVLDVMMPEKDGLTVCKEILERDPNTGVIFLTAKGEEMDKVQGLLTGADDYITKPFSPSELMARIESVTRRVKKKASPKKGKPLSSGRYIFDLRARTLTKDGRRIDLTNIELQLMEYFLQNRNRTVTRKEILQRVWGEEEDSDLKIVDVNVRRLRIKIEDDPGKPESLVTIWGMGYKWVEKDD